MDSSNFYKQKNIEIIKFVFLYLKNETKRMKVFLEDDNVQLRRMIKKCKNSKMITMEICTWSSAVIANFVNYIETVKELHERFIRKPNDSHVIGKIIIALKDFEKIFLSSYEGKLDPENLIFFRKNHQAY